MLFSFYSRIAPFKMLEITSIQWMVFSEDLKHSFLLVLVSEILYYIARVKQESDCWESPGNQ